MLGRDRGRLPECCVLDFDGELAPIAKLRFGARQSSVWPCFHTRLLCVEKHGFSMGLIARTVGAPFAVIVA